MTLMSNKILNEFYNKYGYLPFNYKKNEIKKEDESEDKDKENIKEVKKATTLTTENVHGGKEATKDIENSPNNANNGIQNKQNSNKEGETGENKNKGGNQKSSKEANKEGKDNVKTNSFSLNKHHTVSEINDILNNRKSSLLNLNRQIQNEEEATTKIVKIIKQISKKHSGFNYTKSLEGSYDTNAIAKHLVSYKKHLIPRDKHKKSGAKTITFFIDTSMSMYLYKDAIVKAIDILEKQGFKCILIGGGNGLWDEDVEDDCYRVRNTLEGFGVGTVPKLCRLTIGTSIKLCNSSEFSVIVADFDGLSDFVKLAQGCNKDKVPYFLSTENRYSWIDPCEHDWVSSEYCKYDMSKVYDISYVNETEEY